MQKPPAAPPPHRPQSLGEEIANSITHGLGAILSVAGLAVLLVAAIMRGAAIHIAACAVFGASLVLLYTSSTLYHALAQNRAKRVFHVLDHATIYILIAGTYTPFTLVTLHGPWGWTLFAAVWSLAVLGIVFKSFGAGRLPFLSTAIYILMGWAVVFALRPLLAALPWTGFLWLLAGGLFYTAGVAFFALRRRYAHSIWHLFVLAGSVCHYVAVYRFVIPPG
jgi:hemolysin III